MKRILVVMEDGGLCRQIRDNLQKDFEVLLCHDAVTAGIRMEEHPDAMILQLELAGTDGLTFLEQLTWRPAVILVIGAVFTPYVAQKIYDLNIGYTLRFPVSFLAVTNRIRDMLKDREYRHMDHQSTAASHLRVLGISPDKGGGKHLRVGIPLYAQNPEQKVTQELYPAIACCCGTSSGIVEHSIRNTIHAAWKQRNAEDWKEYFPGRSRCPGNKVFISTLAEKL